MNSCRVSVIMAVYNASDFVEEAILSILNQSYSDFELIIVNDCSTDNSLDIIQKYSNIDNRIILINNHQNLGRVRTRNQALKLAKGEFIAILDSDDISMLDRLEVQITFLENHLNIFLVGSGAIKIDKEGLKIGTHNPITNHSKVEKVLKEKNCIYHSTIMFRNEGFFYREKFLLSQDYDFYLQLLVANKRLTNIGNHLIKYRIYSDAASWKHAAKQRLFANKALDFYFNKINKIEEGYDLFDPNSILKLDLINSTDKMILETEIVAFFKISKYKDMREVCLKYFSNYGVFNKYFLIYLLSFFGTKTINLLRRYN